MTLSPLIILLVATQFVMSLEPISNFVHLIHLFVCAPLVQHVARLCVTPSRWLRYVSHSVGEFTLLILGPSTYSPRCDCSYDFLVSCVLLLVRETQL
jgi:hypothetical protein